MATKRVDALFVNLKLLAACRPYEKLNTRSQFFELVPPEGTGGVPSWLARWWRGENRADALQKIHDLYCGAGELLNMDGVSEMEKERLRKHLMQSIGGVESLKKTYELDKTTIAKLDCIMDVALSVVDGQTPRARDLSRLLVAPQYKLVAKPVPAPSDSDEFEED
jgi:hypothetical protein